MGYQLAYTCLLKKIVLALQALHRLRKAFPQHSPNSWLWNSQVMTGTRHLLLWTSEECFHELFKQFLRRQSDFVLKKTSCFLKVIFSLINGLSDVKHQQMSTVLAIIAQLARRCNSYSVSTIVKCGLQGETPRASGHTR
ncbi:uncharacterized protein LOC126470514 [Schistocerca serialis cubense]|uniref:uncharacterized protein LOC126470514 n=1 Tax=Schistocerca serialis cubense TaxID=2023355 RepID=UPI00214E3278|nr:uncharacterized protein LOC126470514 [Schistocerca serialis cubense]